MLEQEGPWNDECGVVEEVVDDDDDGDLLSDRLSILERKNLFLASSSEAMIASFLSIKSSSWIELL